MTKIVTLAKAPAPLSSYISKLFGFLTLQPNPFILRGNWQTAPQAASHPRDCTYLC